MKENEIVWRTLEHREFEAFKTHIIPRKASEIIENYDLIKDESALSTTQLQALVRTSFVLPGSETKSLISLFSIEQECATELDGCNLPPAIKKKFKEEMKISLPEDLVVKVSSTNQEWWLTNGLYIFNIKKEGSNLNIYDLKITRFIRRQANKGKPNQGYNKLHNNVKLGEALCSYLWYNIGGRDLTQEKQDIYVRLTANMNKNSFSIPVLANPDIIHAKLVQEFVGYFVDLILTKRKERKEKL